MSEEREKRPAPTEFRIVDINGTFLTIPRTNFGYDMYISLEGSNIEGERTIILADFPSPINGGGRHPKTMEALSQFGSVNLPKIERDFSPITTSTKDDSSGNDLMISVTSEGNIHVTIKGKSSRATPNQEVTFTLGHQDKGFSEELLSAFANLARAIQEDEARIQGQSSTLPLSPAADIPKESDVI